MKIDKVMHTPDQEGITAPIRVTRVEVSCFGCPKAWSGITDKDEEVYVRYRWGYLRIDINGNSVFGCQVDAETEEESKAKYAEMRKKADEGCKFPDHKMIDGMEQSDKVMREFLAGNPEINQYHSYSGDIQYDELRRLTKNWFIWPESESES